MSTQNTEQSTERFRVALTERCIHTPRKLPNIHAPKVVLPPADERVRAKVKLHLWCCFIGALASIALSFTFGDWFAVHIAPGIPAAPSAIANMTDRIRNR